jgi:hypothetical protein
MRLRIALILLAFSLALFSPLLQAETTVIDPAIAASHLRASTPAVYPPSALASHITGTVTLAVAIDASGFVTSAKPISGPPALMSSAVQAAKLRVYEPFTEAGNAVAATTTVSIDFGPAAEADPNDVSSATLFAPLAKACHAAVSGNAPVEEQIAICRKAANVADTLPASDYSVDRYTAYVFAATAYSRNHLFEVAVIYADRAIRITEQKHYTDPGISAIYTVRAEAELGLGNLAASDRDLERAESSQRAALTRGATQTADNQSSQNLKALLIFHAQILSALHKSAEAQAKSHEAASI